ncbi:hypothetical protein B4135_1355 [Caldibacillus debilis]|uniref:Uncharacterized protein n=1 Tax=Caldibacillus debilis TaxID=301148 RepID=A0A150MD26_9BACI|nr:hypothetical protein B4135_1355 [Caldibacillus debilis]
MSDETNGNRSFRHMNTSGPFFFGSTKFLLYNENKSARRGAKDGTHLSLP